MSLSTDEKPYRCEPLTVTNSTRGRFASASFASATRSRFMGTPPPGVDQERVHALVVGPLRQRRRLERFLKETVQFERTFAHFFERDCARADLHQLRAVLGD